MQGGLHPDFDIGYYIDLLKAIKARFNINVHGFSPPEICYIADRSDLTIKETLNILRAAGLDSIPGGGAEILSDRVREILSPKKIKSSSWLKVMENAHMLGMRTTATMMFGSVEKPEDIIEHLDAIRNLQDKTGGFTAFIPWTFQPGNTELVKKRSAFSVQRSAKNSSLVTRHSSLHPATAVEYLRVLALSRLYLDNVENIQASWVTQGLKIAEVALRFGANDFGSTMIEENVVASTGISYSVSMEDIIRAIKNAGFKAAQRDTYYNILKKVLKFSALCLCKLCLCLSNSLVVVPCLCSVPIYNRLMEVTFEFRNLKPPVIIKRLYHMSKNYFARDYRMIICNISLFVHCAMLKLYLKPCTKLLRLNLHALCINLS